MSGHYQKVMGLVLSVLFTMRMLSIWLPDNLIRYKRGPVIGTGLYFPRSKFTPVYNTIKDNKANSLLSNSN